MGIPSAVAKQVRYKKEVTFNTAPGASGAQLLRRVESILDIDKDTYQSAEKRSDYQVSDFRHGVRKSTGTLKGELSPKTYADFMGAALRRDFAAVTPITAASITIAAGSLVNGIQQYTVTRAAGSYLTDGVKAGDVVRLSVGTFNAANLAKNLYVISLTATVLTVVPLNGVALVAEGPIATSTVTVYGKKTFVPVTGHTDTSFCFEHWFADALPTLSEVYPGIKIGSIDVGLPATGMATIDMGLTGPGSITTATTVYYTAPTALTTTGVAAAVNGVLYVGGLAVAILTSLSFKVDGGYGADPVVGSNSLPAIFPGKVNITGNFSAYFDAATFRDAFLNETEIALSMVFSSDNTAAADFLAFNLPRIKLGSAKKAEGDKGLTITCDFQALFNGAGGAGIASEQTTLSVQDSAA
jgi:hypothetical protein